MSDPIVIVSAARTAMGSFQGGFSGLTAANLGAEAIKAAVVRAGLDANLIEEVLMAACCKPARVRPRPARLRCRPACRSVPAAPPSTRSAARP